MLELKPTETQVLTLRERLCLNPEGTVAYGGEKKVCQSSLCHSCLCSNGFLPLLTYAVHYFRCIP